MLGGPKLAEACAISHARLKADAEAHADAVMPMIREAQAAGRSRCARSPPLSMGVATARGGKWEAQTVANVLRPAEGGPIIPWSESQSLKPPSRR